MWITMMITYGDQKRITEIRMSSCMREREREQMAEVLPCDSYAPDPPYFTLSSRPPLLYPYFTLSSLLCPPPHPLNAIAQLAVHTHVIISVITIVLRQTANTSTGGR